MTKRITILGSTGSIGDSTLDIISRATVGEFQVVALTANRSAQKLAEQAIKFEAEFVALSDESQSEALKEALAGTSIRFGLGQDALVEG